MTFQCRVCGLRFKSFLGLLSHQQLSHKERAA
jgi:hypothetical protein